jgi:hypothetical protein
VSDLSTSIQEDGQTVGELNSIGERSLNTVIDNDIFKSKIRVDSNSICFMAADIIGNFVGNIFFISVVCLSDIIWIFSLEEVNLTILSIPFN